MADERRSNRGGKPAGRPGRPKSSGSSTGGRGGRSGGGRPGAGRSSDRRDGGGGRGGEQRRDGGRGGDERRDGKPSTGRGGPRAGGRADGPKRGGGSDRKGGYSKDRGGKPGGKPPRRFDEPREERTADQRAYDGPELPPEVTGKELDRAIAAQLRGLPEKLAARIARHLVAADMYIDSDPELAYQHAKAAKSRTQRIAVIREALGEAAYAAGHYSEALAELRAAKRMNGATAYLPIMADCHRALGQPEQAIKLAHSPSVVNFEAPAKAEMTIVEAGARRDMGQYDAALRILEQSPLNNKSREPWVVRLRYAYADTLQDAGRDKDALTWFHRTYAIDADEITDAAARAEALEKTVERD
ncbi:tetratricopeptide repeat protein [Nocardioides sp. KC13]|uniref:Tetratricopeptide repeat protein n=1 Tax=Nocardioides turkmenicus TaxID=2711220 RepID=A0A6M1R8T2_9ACTN|nr:tetratricopeptide repeat protein [Nocardioides sp. KC13]NGN96002.1 tetratricopeptide repeat protein [Nocardioides sp. KC13]